MQITHNFDGGNIEVIDITSPQHIQLKIRPDNKAKFAQWFYFLLKDAQHQVCKIHLINAYETSYAAGWKNYQAVASYDRQTWFRVATDYDGKQLIINHTPEYSQVYYAYFAPYSYEQHLDLIAKAQMSSLCHASCLGITPDNHDLTLLTIGNDEPQKLKFWITARQHAGETMAEWFIEGLLSRLLDNNNALARELLHKAVFYIIPNMNPDGSVRGHLRANAKGTDLNRQWLKPDLTNSPEVYWVKERMQQTGVDFYFDVHGDEITPYIYVLGSKANPTYSNRIANLEQQFKQLFQLANPDFQDVHNIDTEIPADIAINLSSNAIAAEFNCLSLTLEMPFKDNANAPDPRFGWSPARSQQLGYSLLEPLYAMLDKLGK